MLRERINSVAFITDPLGGTLNHRENPFNNPTIWTGADFNPTNPYKKELLPIELNKLDIEQQMLLAEVIMFLPYIEKGLPIPEETLSYVRSNEFTSMTEALTDGVINSTSRRWDARLRDQVAYNHQLIHMLGDGITGKDGVEGIFDLAKKDKRYTPELHRRQIEMNNQLILNEASEIGLLESHINVSFSPFPFDMDMKTAAKLGYFVDEKVGMIRLFTEGPNKQIVTMQISVPNCNLKALTNTIDELQSIEGSIVTKVYEYSKSTNILGTQIFIPKDCLPRGIVDIIEMHDNQLSQINGDSYFLGKQVNSGTQHNYDQIYRNTNQADEGLQNALTHLVKFDRELAVSLVNQSPTPTIVASILSFIKSSNQIELSYSEIDLLNMSLVNITPHGAALIKKLETIKIYAFASTAVNPEKARQIFHHDNSAIQQAYADNHINHYNNTKIIDTIFRGSVTFFRCGLEISKGQQLDEDFSLSNTPMSNIKNAFFGSVEKDSKGSLEFPCHLCGAKNKRPRGKTIKYCRSCGGDISCGHKTDID